MIQVDYEGASTGAGTLDDPLLGVFASDCTSLNSDDDGGEGTNSRVRLLIPSDGVIVLAVTQFGDDNFDGTGEDSGSYQISVRPILQISPLSSCENLPAAGGVCAFEVDLFNPSNEPFEGVGWSIVSAFGTGPTSNFTQFQIDDSGFQAPALQSFNLGPGESAILQFQFDVPGVVRGGAGFFVELWLGRASDTFYDAFGPFFISFFSKGANEPGESEQQLLRVLNVQRCPELPPEGGTCRFSVEVAAPASASFEGAIWSVVQGFVRSSPFSSGLITNFQAMVPGAQTPTMEPLSLASGERRMVEFEFEVPSTVTSGSGFAVSLFLGQGAHPAYNVLLGGQFLFFVFKG